MSPAAALLALAAAALAALLAFELRPLPGPPPGLAARTPAGTPGPALAGADPDARLSATVATLLGRPLFSQTRRPPDLADPATAGATPLPRMTGILIDGDRRSAIFAAAEGGKPTIVGEGGRVGAFTVQRIEPQLVIVAGPDGQRTVRTSFDPNPPAPAAAPSLVVPPQFPGIASPGAAAAAPFPIPSQGPAAFGLPQPAGAAR